MTTKNLNISIDKRGLPSNAETEQPLSSHYSTATNHFTPYDTPSPTAHQVSIFVFLPFFITSLLINNEKYCLKIVIIEYKRIHVIIIIFL